MSAQDSGLHTLVPGSWANDHMAFPAQLQTIWESEGAPVFAFRKAHGLVVFPELGKYESKTCPRPQSSLLVAWKLSPWPVTHRVISDYVAFFRLKQVCPSFGLGR